MRIFSISYDLNFQKNYPILYDLLRSTRTWAKVNQSHWFVLVSDNQSILDAFYKVRSIMDNDDFVFLIDITIPIARGDYAGRMPVEVCKWVSNYEMAFQQMLRIAA